VGLGGRADAASEGGGEEDGDAGHAVSVASKTGLLSKGEGSTVGGWLLYSRFTR
jgi:hypothetical protein